MMRILLFCLVLVLPSSVFAQSQSDEDRGYIQGLLEDALSSSGRQVQIIGFAGALSSRATIDQITIADGQGIWLTAEDLALTWRRSALLRGNIEIDEISIGKLIMPRAPVAEDDLPSPEASGGFSLPELPVSVQIADFNITRGELGEALMGQAVAFSAQGNASLADGAGEVELTVDRLDAGGELRLAGSYSNTSKELVLDLGLEEPANGIAATLLDLPGQPSVALSITGDSPVTDFVADISLSTDGQERVAGTVELLTETVDGGTVNRFRAVLDGDVAPVVAPQYGDFLGNQVSLVAEGARDADGSMALSTLEIGSQALSISGNAKLAPDGWPRNFSLEAKITPPRGSDVILPIPGASVSVARADLIATFDDARDDAWTLRGQLDELKTDGFAARRFDLDGGGRITRDSQTVSGRVDLSADGIDPQDEALASAIGDTVTGLLDFSWQNGGPIRFHELDLSGEDYGLTGTVAMTDPTGAAGLTIRPDVTLNAQSLARFAALAGIDLTGAAELDVLGSVSLLTGGFDIDLNGTTRALAVGIEQVDPLLRGEGTVAVSVIRDETGLRADQVDIQTDAAKIEATAEIATGNSSVRAEAILYDTALALPGLAGRSQLTVNADQSGDRWDIRTNGTFPGDARIGFEGSVTGDGKAQLLADGALTAQIARLETYAQLAGQQNLSGAINLNADATVDLLALSGQISADGTTQGLRTGIEQVDGLLGGATRFDVTAARDGDGIIRVGKLELDGSNITATAQFVSDFSLLRADVIVPETARVLPGLSGRSQVTVRADKEGDRWQVRADGQFPGDARIGFDGIVLGSPDTQLEADGTLTARIDRLSAYSQLAGRALSGSAQLTADADVELLSQTGTITARGDTQGLRFAVPAIEPLIRGTTTFDLAAARDQSGAIQIDRLLLDGPGIDANASGRISDNDGSVQFRVSLPNLGAVVPQLPGAASVAGTAARQGSVWRLDVDGQGPSGITLDVAGTASEDFQSLNLDVTGGLPLTVLAAHLPQQSLEGQVRFDLAVNGPPALSSVSGEVVLSDARAFAPAADMGVENVGGVIRLANERAQMDITGRLNNGGDLEISGPVTLTSPFTADLVAQFRNARLGDGELYETTANGRITVSGPLTGGARIGGDVSLEEVELRIPQTGPSFAILDGLEHVNTPADVQRTLQFAGLTGQAEDKPLPDFPVDLTVNAPNRIFVRGRGLDAELGGRLRLTGSTNNLVPVGQFDLIRGRLDLLGRRLVLTEGAVSLRGSFDPYVSFTATSEVEEIEISIRIEGFASEPELIVTSSPQLPQDEVLSLFLFGRAIQEISALQAVQLAAAVRTLSGRGGLGITDQIRQGLGVDDLDIGTDSDGNVQARAGAYISENIYTDLTVNSQGESQINLNLDLTPNVTVRGRLGSDGDSGIGVFFERDY